ncbi:uncharacterized protein LOC125861247 [Solanum stenotomum]|uniref:uncharacterized protein LOC125861247 n=1 Tax=Solanum stenotomum TaxID=172797 RepID=UPI0020D0148E|nr:uncharacterized protein LOC125861247 [Solanum stenotomum]
MPGVRTKTLKNTHDCNEAFDNGRVDHLTIAYYFKSKLQNDAKYRIKDMRDDLKERFDVNVSHGKCKRAKRLILEKLERSFTDDYNRLEAYANELRSSNPGSDVIINISKDALANGKRRFLTMFICFHALKMGFKDGLRPFIGLDGTFLKGKAKGQLLTVVGQDCQSHSYLIAWAVVDKETKRTWNWFLGHLKRSLDLKEVGEGITFISDMQKGLLQAVKDVFPESHHRFCAKHVEANWCKTWRSEELHKVFWWCSWTTYEEDFKDKLNMIGSLDKAAAEDLLKYPPNAWCRAYFDTVCKNYEVVNNFTESVNKWILEARGKPIIKMLEEIRTKVMNQLRKKEDEVRFWATEFSPKSMQLFNEYMKIAQKCKVNFNGDYGYEITEGCDRHTVNMILKRCTCRQWDLNGIPCPHAISAMLYNKLDPLSEMSWWYSKEAFLLTYRHKLQPVRSEKFWKVNPHQAMEPPDLVKMVGRPKTKRVRKKDEAIKRQGEWASSRKGRVMTCNNCGEPNHNSKGCKKVKYLQC